MYILFPILILIVIPIPFSSHGFSPSLPCVESMNGNGVFSSGHENFFHMGFGILRSSRVVVIVVARVVYKIYRNCEGKI